jgi:alpha-1,6-mannosyltransferase
LAYGIDDAHIVPLGVDLERFHPRRRSHAVRARYGVADGSPLLVYAGRLDAEKHPNVLLEAFAQLEEPRPVLLLLGEGPQRAELEARAATIPGAHVLPFESDAGRLAELLASADVYVTAGPHETFGLSVIEAQSAGLPVVGVAAGALVERVPPSVGRLGPVGDARAMARNIEAVLAAGELMRRAARQHVEAGGFGWSNTFERLLRIYEARLEAAEAGLALGP